MPDPRPGPCAGCTWFTAARSVPTLGVCSLAVPTVISRAAGRPAETAPQAPGERCIHRGEDEP
jgi:hypothetical protein